MKRKNHFFVLFPFMLSYAAASLLFITLCGLQFANSDNAPKVEIKSTETNSRLVEDGGTGLYSALMVSDSRLFISMVERKILPITMEWTISNALTMCRFL